MDAATETDAILAVLSADPDLEYAAQSKRYHKSDLTFIGARMPVVRKTATGWLAAHRGIDREDLLALLCELWARPVFESRMVASVIAEKRSKLLTADDLPMLEQWVRDAAGWALADQIVPRAVGDIVRRDPELRRRTMIRWATDPDFWMRRSAVLVQLLDLRHEPGGTMDWDTWESIAVPLLADDEWFIRKAIGWFLREAGKRDPDRVVAFVDAHRDAMSPLTLREATRNL